MPENKQPVLEHASRPGIKDCIVMTIALLGCFAIAYSEPLKRFFGIE